MNPFKPTAGKMPPELIGRDSIIEDFIDGIENGVGAPERLMRLTGARGMGKTVLLNELGRIVKDKGWLVIDEIATPGLCIRILEELTSRNQLASLHFNPSVLGISLGSVEIERASLNLRKSMVNYLKGNKSGLLITLDEVQDVTIDEVRALSVAIQQVIGEDLNIAFVFAGLPSMVDHVVNAKALTFLRRALPEDLIPLWPEDVKQSFLETIADSGMDISESAAEYMTEASAGYPFMVQLVGYYTWRSASKRNSGIIELNDAVSGAETARKRFDRMVIEPAIQNLPATLLTYLIAMAEDKGAPSKVGVVAERLGKDLTALSSYRSRLIKENIIESRMRGEVEFVIPYMAEYLNEHYSILIDEMNY